MQTGKHGAILIAVMSFLTVLMLLASTIHVIMTVNARQSAYSVSAAKAFEQANAGADYVLGRVRADALSGVVTLDAASVPVNYPAPAGYSFDTVTNLTRLSNTRAYLFRVVGREGDARAVIDVVVSHDPNFLPGAFGNQSLSLGPTTRIYSYRSSVDTTPTTSTDEATAASNQNMGGSQTAVDGTIYLGENTSGTPASYAHEFSSSATVVRSERINPDPLGAGTGMLSNQFVYVSVTNANSTAIGGSISAGKLNVSGDVTLRAGSYYVSQIDIGSHKTLTIDASAGPVKIYLLGSASTQPTASIVVDPPLPANFIIYSRSTASIDFQPNNAFVGFIYAPFASVTIQPNADFYGALWANALTIKPNGAFYEDVDFLESFDTDTPLTRLSWKHVLE